MPLVTLSDATDTKLKSLVTDPFEDTRESLIAFLIDAEVERRGIQGDRRENSALRLDPDSHDNLRHTRLISATVEGQPIHRPKWNSVMAHIHILGRKRLATFDALQGATGARLRDGRYEENGFKYLPEADISIQGVDANLAWSYSLRLARALRIPLAVLFEWLPKEGAARPGHRALLQWSPTAGLPMHSNRTLTREEMADELSKVSQPATRPSVPLKHKVDYSQVF